MKVKKIEKLAANLHDKTEYDETENINVWVFVWLCKTKIWWKDKIVFYEYSKFHCIHETDDIYEVIYELKFQILQIMN